MVDFTVDFTIRTNEILNREENHQWTLEIDRASNARGGGISLALTSSNGLVIEQSLYCDFLKTNNEVEYEAIIAGLKVAQ